MQHAQVAKASAVPAAPWPRRCQGIDAPYAASSECLVSQSGHFFENLYLLMRNLPWLLVRTRKIAPGQKENNSSAYELAIMRELVVRPMYVISYDCLV
jgi:hypothetical protein